MHLESLKRGLVVAALAVGVVACDNSLMDPSRLADDSLAAADRKPVRVTPKSPERPKRPERPDTAARRRCRADNELSQEQIAKIRALYNAYEEAIADDLRLIAKVTQEAREAAAAGASREEIRQILSRADEAKEHIAEATARLRAAIAEVLGDDRVPCFVNPVAR